MSKRKGAVWALAGVAAAESSFFPIPPDPILISMSLARPKRSFLYATVCTLASVLGGVGGYLLGYYLFGAVVHPTMEALGLSAKWFGSQEGVRVLAANVQQMVSTGIVEQTVAASLTDFLNAISPTLSEYEFYTDGLFFKGIAFFNRYGVLTVFMAAFTFIPYKVFTISAGLFGQPFLAFAAASIAGRGMRFYAVSALFYFFGPSIEPWLRRNLEWMALLFALLLFGGFLLIRYL